MIAKIFLCLSLFLLYPSYASPNVMNKTLAPSDNLTEGSFNPEEAVEAYIQSLPAEERAMSDRYGEGNYWHLLWDLLVEMAIAGIFLFLGLSKWMKKISVKLKNINLQNTVYIILYFLFSFILIFPYSAWKGFIREHRFGLSNMSFGEWLGEELTGLMVTIVLLGILLLIIYKIIRKTKERWWIWAWGISTVFIIFVIYISPVFLAPLFNEYTELPDGSLKQEILSLAKANGIPSENVYKYNGSKQTKGISANVNGIGNTIRISLSDNLLERCNDEEIKAVMAHEMGHYVLNHVQKMVVLFSILFFIGFALIHYSFQWFWMRWGKRCNISGISDIAGLPLMMVLLSFFIFLSTPITNNISRQDELEADIFGLNAAREPDGFAGAAMMTSEYRKASPAKWEEILFYDHPSPRSRVMMAMRWKAENLSKKKKSNNTEDL